MERAAVEGDSPVCEMCVTSGRHPSIAGLVKPGVNHGGPPPKAKYYQMTGSEQ